MTFISKGLAKLRRQRSLAVFGPATTAAPKTELLLYDPIFAKSYASALRQVHERMGWPPAESGDIDESTTSARFGRNFVYEVAAQLSAFSALEACGIRFDAVAGISLGELAAVQAAGATTVDETIRIATSMVKEVTSATGGDLLTVSASVDRARNALGSLPAISILGWPDESVWAVRDEHKAELHTAFVAGGLTYTLLDIGCMPHTSRVNRSRFATSIGDATVRRPSIDYFSSAHGGRFESMIDPVFWGRMCAEPLRFAEMNESLEREGFTEVVMIGTISTERHLFSNLPGFRRPRFQRAEDILAESSRVGQTG